MALKAKLEAIIYVADTPVTVEQLIPLVKDELISEGTSDPTEIKSRVRAALEELVADYYAPDHGIEIRQVAGGYRMSTKPEQHDVARAFVKSLKPPIRLSLPALETLAVIAYKQPVTVPEINEVRGVDSGGVISTLLDRKLITTAGRKAVVGRPILYKTTKEFLLRFGLKDVHELPSMEEFEKLVAASFESDAVAVNGAESSTAPEGTTELPFDKLEERTSPEDQAGTESAEELSDPQSAVETNEQATDVGENFVEEVAAEAVPVETYPADAAVADEMHQAQVTDPAEDTEIAQAPTEQSEASGEHVVPAEEHEQPAASEEHHGQ